MNVDDPAVAQSADDGAADDGAADDGAADHGTSGTSEPAQQRASRAALERYAAHMRPRRIGYAAAIVAAIIVLVVVVVVAWNRGEASHATLRTAASAPPSVALQAPSAQQQPAWSDGDATAIGIPYWQGTVITHDEHTVRGRDARTGTVTWSYTRTDRTVCTAIQDQGVTIAVYQLHGNCDELTAFDSGTGQRHWTRTLDKNGSPFNGPASYSVQSGSVMFVSATAIYDVAIGGTADKGNGGLDFWVFDEQGCRINSAVAGTGGALISQTCAGRACTGLKHCGNGPQLLLRDAQEGENTDSSKNHGNPDQILWNRIGSKLVPVTSGQVVAARDPGDDRLDVLETQTGRLLHRLPFVSGATTTVSSADTDLIWSGGTTYALQSAESGYTWRARTNGPPTVTGTGTDPNPPMLATAKVAVASPSGIALLDGNTGRVRRSFATQRPPATGSLVYPFGTGFVVAGNTTAAYR